MAGRIAIYDTDPDEVPWPIRCQIGDDILTKNKMIFDDKQIFEITVSEFRDVVSKDDVLQCIKHIISICPGQSITDLLNLTHKDLIELVCFCEIMMGKMIFNLGDKKGRTLINPKSLPDDGKSLQNKMNDLNKFLGVPK